MLYLRVQSMNKFYIYFSFIFILVLSCNKDDDDNNNNNNPSPDSFFPPNESNLRVAKAALFLFPEYVVSPKEREAALD